MSDALRILDVSQLEPPEPLQRALVAIDTLTDGVCLCLRHRREPQLLYPILEQHGFDYIISNASATDTAMPIFHIYIWRRQDAVAEAAAHRALSPVP